MLLTGFTKEIFRSKCMPHAQSLHCYAHLNEDIGKVIPYLNSSLGGSSFSMDPPSVTFKIQGKLISVHANKIAINALRNEEETDKILNWLKNEINTAWQNRENIEPMFKSAPQPTLIEILKLLPKTNCKACHEPTCMVFATKVMEGLKDGDDCPDIDPENKTKLSKYLSCFHFEI
ncbi:MAG: Fe-S cluster protein [Desulfobacteraceae bacterium]|nr:Fe-S cluster protein [Desulfobacteraceae bacterium]